MKTTSPKSLIFVLSCFLLLLSACKPSADSATSLQTTVSREFEKIRNNQAMLQLFFSGMPKGGDLHNHLTGSVYAETYFDIGCENGYYIDTLTFKMYGDKCRNGLQLKKEMKNLHTWRVHCIDAWSIRNFEKGSASLPPDEFFFSTFGTFATASSTNLARFLKELKVRAASEHVAYLEIMAKSPEANSGMIGNESVNTMLKTYIAEKDSVKFDAVLKQLASEWAGNNAANQSVDAYIRSIETMHGEAHVEGNTVQTLYQAYVGRNADPLKVFAQLYIGFVACKKSPYLVGVNIVQAENSEVSIRDYWGHTRMFRFLTQYTRGMEPKGDVAKSLHAGELTLGLIQPEELQFHIWDAVAIAGADRIGHGVDVPFEMPHNNENVLTYMADRKIAIEINLTSNEFILGVKDDAHPMMLYKAYGVPIVICTDDPGILRTNLTEQYVLAAKRYPELTYEDFKEIIRNSITYSFAPHTGALGNVKQKLMEQLENDLIAFEKQIPVTIKSYLDAQTN